MAQRRLGPSPMAVLWVLGLLRCGEADCHGVGRSCLCGTSLSGLYGAASALANYSTGIQRPERQDRRADDSPLVPMGTSHFEVRRWPGCPVDQTLGGGLVRQGNWGCLCSRDTRCCWQMGESKAGVAREGLEEVQERGRRGRSQLGEPGATRRRWHAPQSPVPGSLAGLTLPRPGSCSQASGPAWRGLAPVVSQSRQREAEAWEPPRFPLPALVRATAPGHRAPGGVVGGGALLGRLCSAPRRCGREGRWGSRVWRNGRALRVALQLCFLGVGMVQRS